MKTLPEMIKDLRQAKGLTQKQLGIAMKLPYQSVQKWEKAKGTPTTKQLPLLAQILGVQVEQLVGAQSNQQVQSQGQFNTSPNQIFNTQPNLSPTLNARILPPSQYVELPYLSALGRVRFMKQFDPLSANFGLTDTFPVRQNPGEDLAGQFTIEIMHDDAMAPLYVAGTVMRVLPVEKSDWPYLDSGIYAVAFGNQFVVRRLRDNDRLSEGLLVLHADNPATGGTTHVPLDQVHYIFKVIRVVDAPVQ